MQTLKKKFQNGSVHTYTLTEPDSDGSTSHRWATKDGKPFLHIMPSDEGYCNLFIHCGDAGYRKQGELIVPFEKINIEMIAI